MSVHTEPHPSSVAAATQLVLLGCTPAQRPTTDDGYATLIGQYLSDPGFRQQVAEAAAGMGLRILNASPVLGLAVAADATSPLAADATWWRERLRLGSVADRLVAGVALAGIAAYCYPTRQSQTEPATVRFGVSDIDEVIAGHIADVQAGDCVLDDDLIVAWQAWDDRPAAEQTDSGRWKKGSRAYMITAVCRALTDLGLLLHDTTGPADQWRPTDRFRQHVAAHAGTVAYDALAHSPLADRIVADRAARGADQAPPVNEDADGASEEQD